MSVTKTEIFIASRFEEFSELRRQLKIRIDSFPVFPLQAVDLNDNVSGGTPPVGKCLAAVKRAEVMILLVGETYGGSPSGEDLSYTHLEYRAAIDENSNTVVLPFFINSTCIENRFGGYSKDKKLADWQKEIIDNHTPAFLDSSNTAKDLCSVIFDAAYKAIYDARSESIQEQMDRQTTSEDLDPADVSAGEALDDSVGLSHNEMERLDSMFDAEDNAVFDSAESSFQNVTDILLRPAEAAALEQKKEAFKAIELGDRFVAIRHFRKALELRPLDFTATYWLARLLVSSGKNSDCRDAIRYGLKAARMASYGKRSVKASASLLIASKAASALNEFDEALEYAQRAVQETPWLAAARIEVASQLAGSGQVDEALKEVRRAFFSMPQILLKVNREPTFVRLGKRYQDFKRALREMLLKEATQILNDEAKARQLLNGSENLSPEQIQSQLAAMPAKPLLNICYEGRGAAKRQLSFLQQQASSLSGMDDNAVNRYHQDKLDEHEQSLKQNDKRIGKLLGDRKKISTQLFISAGIAALSLFIALQIKNNNQLLFILSLAVLASSVSAFNKWKTYRNVSNDIEKLQQHSRTSDSVKTSISNEAGQLRQQAADRLKAICSGIMAFEKHVMQSQTFCVGRSIKAAKPGDIIYIDSVLQENILKNAVIDDSIAPDSLAVYIPSKEYENNSRIKLYRLVEYRNGQPVLSRSAVFFNDKAGRKRIDMNTASNRINAKLPMILEYEDDGYLNIRCQSCGKSSVVRSSMAFRTQDGYRLNGEGTCSCGLAFDTICFNDTNLVPGMIARES